MEDLLRNATTAFCRIPDIIASSFNDSHNALVDRVKRGEQPSWALDDYAIWRFVIAANVVYFTVTAALYWWMSNPKREKFELKPFMAVYNVSCVLLAGYVFVGVVVEKIHNPGT